MILLNADVLELKNKPNHPLEAYIIESKVDKKRGATATAIVKTGTLSVGQDIFIKKEVTKVKAMFDCDSKPIKTATPSTPVQILGFADAPPVGEKITDTATTDSQDQVESPVRIQQTSDPKISLVIKADTQGTLEALLNSLPDDVKIMSSSIGPVTDNDIFLASTSGAQIFAFNVKTTPSVKNLAKTEGVKIVETKIIYEILEDVEKQLQKIVEPTIDEEVTGLGQIIAEFKIDKVRIAGIKCTQGVLKKGDTVHLKRKEIIIKDSKIENIRQAKTDVDQIKQGVECGITFKPYIDFKVEDVIISYKKEK
jgi:translation initiation factor IF-2